MPALNNPKKEGRHECRLFWCLIEFIDWTSGHQSVMLVFSTPLVN
jgi:hypothetical protein